MTRTSAAMILMLGFLFDLAVTAFNVWDWQANDSALGAACAVFTGGCAVWMLVLIVRIAR